MASDPYNELLKIFKGFTNAYQAYLTDYGDEQLDALKQTFPLRRTFSELLLLSIIRANRIPPRDRHSSIETDSKRLTIAHEALFGRPPSQAAHSTDDYRALMWMAEVHDLEMQNKRENLESPKPRSVLQLAKRIYSLDHKHSQDQGADEEYVNTRMRMSSADHLRKKFPEFYELWKKEIEENGYRQIEIMTLYLSAIETIERILRIFGVESYAED